MGGRSTGAVEVHHTLCLCQRGEPLRAPLTGIVGGLVTDLDTHGVVCFDSVSMAWDGGQRGDWWTLAQLAQPRPPSLLHQPSKSSG